MTADLIVQPIDEIRAAVETLAAGLGCGEVFSPERWDHSVTTLARCHDQVGGDTRRQLYDVFAASAGPEGEDRVTARLEALHERLQGRAALGLVKQAAELRIHCDHVNSRGRGLVSRPQPLEVNDP